VLTGQGQKPRLPQQRRFSRIFKKGDLTDGFSGRDVHQHGWSNLSARDQVQAGLNLLRDLDWIAAVEKRGHAGGRPTIHYHVNPRARQ
jgi:hypothetical protein